MKKIPCREKSGNLEKWVKSGKNQGILQKHVREISGNFQLYIYNDSFPIFQDIYITWFHLKGICPEFQVIRGFSQKIPADLLSYDQIHS